MIQALTYQALSPLGPVWSAVLAGFAVIIWGEVYITPAGESFLKSLVDS